MEQKEKLDAEEQHSYISWQQSNRRGKIATGMIFVFFGILYLMNASGVALEDWVISWQTIMISIGVVVLIKHKFRKLFGYAVIVVGTLFLFKEWYPELFNGKLIWGAGIIAVGLMFIFRPNHHRNDCEHKFKRRWKKHHTYFSEMENLEQVSKDDFIDAVAIFGGVNKNVVSKQFRGADIVTIFGGSEINLSQADFTDKVVLDITMIFGGSTLVIPANWQLKSEMVTIFGGIEDKRAVTALMPDQEEKVVILRGTCLFGGIEINSYQN